MFMQNLGIGTNAGTRVRGYQHHQSYKVKITFLSEYIKKNIYSKKKL